jgi:hypothetical protein
MSIVSEIVQQLKTEIAVLLPDYKETPFTYDIGENDSKLERSFGIKIGSASTVSGVNRHITMNHDFVIEFTRKILTKKDAGDKDMRNKIELIHSDIETVYKALSLRSFSVPSGKVLLISPLDISEPTQEDITTTLSLTVTVQYRTPIN